MTEGRRLPPLPIANRQLAEHEQRRLSERVEENARAISKHENDVGNTLAAIVAHQRVVDRRFDSIERNDERQNETLAAQSVVLAVLARELGVQGRLPPVIARSLPPPRLGAHVPPPPARPLRDELGAEARRSRTRELVVLAVVVAQIVLELLRHGGLK